MKTLVKKLAVDSSTAELLVLPAQPAAGGSARRRLGAQAEAAVRALDRRFEGALSAELARFRFHPAPGRRLDVALGGKKLQRIRVSCVSETFEPDEWRRLGGDAQRSAKQLRARAYAISLHALKGAELEQAVEAVVEGALLAAYEYRRFKSKAKVEKERLTPTLELLIGAAADSKLRQAVARGERLAAAVAFARDLVNCPPSDLPPDALVKAARKIAARSRGRIKLRVLGRPALERMGAGALLAVARGSDAPPYLLQLSMRARTRTKKRKVVALVGKGVTFDSGGLSIKTRPGMEDMKCDMAGAAAVLAAAQALSQTTLPFDLEVLVPTAENMINGNSVKPGDVVRTIAGPTIEILNTDAEGRLLLADAFGYAARLEPDVMIDLATLTGACIAALGNEYAGLFSDDDALAALITESGGASGERCWRLPLAQEYRSLLDSPVGDLKNSPGGPGAITAALFLKEFVPKGTRWAHLDIAGPAFIDKGGDYWSRGATGFGVRTLCHLVETLAAGPTTAL